MGQNYWVIISWQSYHEIERLVKEEPDQLHVMHTEGQNFDEIWSSKPTQKFKTAEEAIYYFSREYSLLTSKVREDLFDRFPKKIKQEYLQTFHNLLFAYSQSRPLFTLQRDEGPFGPNSYRKDDGFIHPNKKY